MAPNDRLPSPGAPDTLYIIDVMWLVFRAFHALPPLTTTKGEPTHAVLGVVRMIQKLVKERAPKHLAVAMESKGRTNRDALFADYKAHRPDAPPDLTVQIPLVEEAIRAFAIPVLAAEGYEADDVIATLARRAAKENLRTVIVSGDKDLLQLVDEEGRIVLYDTFRERVLGPPEVREKFGVGPEQLGDLLALTGDSIDNVPGVPGVGPKTAAKLLGEFGSLEAILTRASEVKQPKLRESLASHVEAARLSRRLVALQEDVDVAFDLAALEYGGWDSVKLHDLLVRLEFRNLVLELGLAPGAAAPAPPPGPEQLTLTAAARAAPTPATAAPPEAAPMPVAAVPIAVETVLSLDRLRELVDEVNAAGAGLAVRAVTVGEPLPRARLVGLALAWRSGHAAYVPFEHRSLGGPAQIPQAAALEILSRILTDPGVPKVGHEIKREDVLLRRSGIRMEGIGFDSMIASYVIDPERYQHRLDQVAATHLGRELPPDDAKDEADEKPVDEVAAVIGQECAAVFDLAFHMPADVDAAGARTLLSDVELPLSRVLADIEVAGVRVDVDHLARLARETAGRLETLESEAHALAGHTFNLGSPKQLQQVLFQELGLQAGRKTKTGFSTDSDVLEALGESHPLPAKILEHRVLAKLKGTYLDALPRSIDPVTKRVHTSYSQAVAATGRLSSNDPNLQNIPIRTELGREIRRAFRAEPGFVLMSADYSQIELRVLAHLSGDPVLTESFRSGEDVHDRTAREVFGVAPGEVTREMRRRAKAINFGVIYGQTEHGLATSLGIAHSEARSFIAAYFRRYARLAQYLEEVIAAAKAGQGVRTVLGRRRVIRELQSTNRAIRAMGERIARNTPIQGSAADIIKIAMIRIADHLRTHHLRTRMLLTVHDELVFEVPEAEVETATRLVRTDMEGAYPLSVPLVVDLGVGATWADVH